MLAGLHGSWLEFPTCQEASDPRPSIRQRYPSREAYLARYADAVLEPTSEEYLLSEDALEMLGEATRSDFWNQ